MKDLSINETAMLTGRDRRTVRHAAEGLQFKTGHHNAKLYPSDKLLAAIYLGDVSKTGEPLTYSEALRRLTIQKEKKVKQDVEIQSGRYMPLDEFEELLANVLAITKSHHHVYLDQVLTFQAVQDCHEELVHYLISTLPRAAQARAKKEWSAHKLEQLIEWYEIEWKSEMHREWRARQHELTAAVRDAWQRNQREQTPESSAALKAAQAACAENDDNHPGSPCNRELMRQIHGERDGSEPPPS